MREIPITPEIAAILERQRRRFVGKFGRQPGPSDAVFFDPNADTPVPMPDDGSDRVLILEWLQKTNVDPAICYAFHKTGRLVTAYNRRFLTDDELAEWDASVADYYRLLDEQQRLPPN